MLNRRTFLQISGLAGLAALSDNNAAAEKRRPNILWLSTEDISPHLGCYGDPHAITPALDRLAAEGALFTNAFVTAPVCAPNRSCVVSGVYAATLGSLHMRSGWGKGEKNNMPEPPPELKLLPEALREAGYYCTNNNKEDYNLKINRRLWDDSSKRAHWRNRPDAAQPFFAVFNFTGTHESQVRGAPEQVARNTRTLTDAQRQRPDALTPPPYHADTADTRRNWANYHKLITALDYWVADLLEQLKEDGLADDTIVIFWSDHGMGMPRGNAGSMIPAFTSR
ncbi:MAG TPA: DUF229 domain-containing protein [Candidatus Hydrogenedentes bacterium]|nr:DUF229 domain-containing protein [Candidatus Hydrogenedentota bacterium]